MPIKKRKVMQNKRNLIFLKSMISILLLLVLYGCVNNDILSKKSLRNLTYKNDVVNFGKVKLVDGAFSENAAPGSVSKNRIIMSDYVKYGEIKGERAAAVILISDTPGSGVFFDLAVIRQNTSKESVIPTVQLGDRIKIDSISFKNDTIIVDFKGREKGESFNRLTSDVRRKFILNGNKIIEIKVQDENNALLNITWKLVKVVYSNDKTVDIEKPEKYKLLFTEDNKVAVKADCNNGFGSYEIVGSSLKIHILGVTRAMCPPQSFSEKYLSELKAVVSYMVKDNKLYLSLKYDSGIMVFE